MFQPGEADRSAGRPRPRATGSRHREGRLLVLTLIATGCSVYDASLTLETTDGSSDAGDPVATSTTGTWGIGAGVVTSTSGSGGSGRGGTTPTPAGSTGSGGQAGASGSGGGGRSGTTGTGGRLGDDFDAAGGAGGENGTADATGTGGGGGSGGGGDTLDAGGASRPTALRVTGSRRSAQQVPSSAGSSFSQTCKTNEVLIGYTGSVNSPDAAINYLRNFRAICGTLSVAETTGFAVETHKGETMSQIGNNTGELTQTAMCPSGQVIVGFGGRAGAFIDALAFACAPLVISKESSSYTLSIGASETIPAVGGPRGTAFSFIPCPDGQIAIGHAGQAGADINSFGLICGTPALVLQE